MKASRHQPPQRQVALGQVVVVHDVKRPQTLQVTRVEGDARPHAQPRNVADDGQRVAVVVDRHAVGPVEVGILAAVAPDGEEHKFIAGGQEQVLHQPPGPEAVRVRNHEDALFTVHDAPPS